MAARQFTRQTAAALLALSLVLSLPAASEARKKETEKPAATAAKSVKTRTATPTGPKIPDYDPATVKQISSQNKQAINEMFAAMHTEDRAIYNELRDDQELAISDVGMLWQAAVERDGTIRFAIEKLSRRDATGKPVENDSFNKRMLQTLTNLGAVGASMMTGSPAGLAAGAFAGDLLTPTSPQDSALSHVTDADMVIIATKVEALQSEILELYYNYRHAQEQLELAQKASSTIAKYHSHAETAGQTEEALKPLVDSIYETARQDEQNAMQAFLSAKTALTLKVGPDAVMALEHKDAKTASN